MNFSFPFFFSFLIFVSRLDVFSKLRGRFFFFWFKSIVSIISITHLLQEEVMNRTIDAVKHLFRDSCYSETNFFFRINFLDAITLPSNLSRPREMQPRVHVRQEGGLT